VISTDFDPVLGAIQSQEAAGVSEHMRITPIFSGDELRDRYLEAGRPESNGTLRPWIWIVLIGLGPIASSLAEQRFYISSVCSSLSYCLRQSMMTIGIYRRRA
jgi:hypothetical protein